MCLNLKSLERYLKGNRWPNAFLFCGPSRYELLQVSLFLSKAVNCQGSSGGAPCNACRSCRMIDSGNHPDVWLIGRKEEVITIGEVRRIRRDALLSPYLAKKKVYIIRYSDRLNLEAANAMLKVLEEPPANVLFILVATSLSTIPPTIISRCRILNFQGLDKEETEDDVSGFVREAIEVLVSGRVDEVFDFSKKVAADRSLVEEFFNNVISFGCKALRGERCDIFSGLEKTRIQRIVDLSVEAMERLSFNCNPRLCIEAFLFSLLCHSRRLEKKGKKVACSEYEGRL